MVCPNGGGGCKSCGGLPGRGPSAPAYLPPPNFQCTGLQPVWVRRAASPRWWSGAVGLDTGARHFLRQQRRACLRGGELEGNAGGASIAGIVSRKAALPRELAQFRVDCVSLRPDIGLCGRNASLISDQTRQRLMQMACHLPAPRPSGIPPPRLPPGAVLMPALTGLKIKEE